MNKRLIERIGMAAVIAAFVAYFCYQVAYGMTETVTSGNITATMTAPSGSSITNLTISPITGHDIDLQGTWHFGAAGKIAPSDCIPSF
jgi:hypothetical protein